MANNVILGFSQIVIIINMFWLWFTQTISSGILFIRFYYISVMIYRI